MPVAPGRMRGAIATPRNMLAAAMPHSPAPGAPANFIKLPAQLSIWGNDRYGDCVTAEEAFAKACNNPEIFISEAEVIDWAGKHGYLNGANLGDVLKKMQTDGFAQGGYTYDDGSFYSVDWTNPTVLESAIALGPVKIGVAADQLETAVDSTGGASGWFATGFKFDGAEDHCVSLCGFGTIAWLAGQLKVSVPNGVNGMETGYALFTWNSIGIIDANSMRAITHEAWLRRPTTVPKVVLGDTSPLSPAIATDGALVFLAWKGDGNNNLNVMCSADGGHTFGGKYTSPEQTSQPPALCVHNGALYIAWKGDGNDQLNVAHVGLAGAGFSGFANKVVLPDTSPASPALAADGTALYLGWKGDGNDNLNFERSIDGGASFGGKVIMGETSPQSPSLAVLNGSLLVAWKGDNNDQLNVAKMPL